MGMLSMYNIRKQKKKFFNNEFSQSLGYATILNNLKLSIMIPWQLPITKINNNSVRAIEKEK